MLYQIILGHTTAKLLQRLEYGGVSSPGVWNSSSSDIVSSTIKILIDPAKSSATWSYILRHWFLKNKGKGGSDSRIYSPKVPLRTPMILDVNPGRADYGDLESGGPNPVLEEEFTIMLQLSEELRCKSCSSG